MVEVQGMKEVDQDRGWLRETGICFVLFILVFAAFATGSRKLGIYSDDSQFLAFLGKANLSSTIWHTRWYVPGRNLHIIWQRLIYFVGGAGPENLGTLHVIQAMLDAVTVVVLYLLLRALKLAEVYALAAASLFAFYPNHAETHFWLSAGPMNIISTLFVIAYALCAVRLAQGLCQPRDLRKHWRLGFVEVVCFGCALFTYDQPIAVLLLILCGKAVYLLSRVPSFRTRRGVAALLLASAPHLALAAWDVTLKLDPSAGPTLSKVNGDHILKTWKEIAWQHVPQALTREQIRSSFRDSGRGNKAAAALVTGTVLCLLLALGWRRRPQALPAGEGGGVGDATPQNGWGVNRHVLLGLLGLTAAAAAYVPCCIWFVSPRHNYLPTAGLALAVGSFAAALMDCAGWVRSKWGGLTGGGLIGAGWYWFLLYLGAEGPAVILILSADTVRPNAILVVSAAAVGAAIIAVVAAVGRRTAGGFCRAQAALALLALSGFYLFHFSDCCFLQKKNWAESYQLRKALYSELVRQPGFGDKAMIRFESFPGLYRETVPFFAQENYLAITFLFPGQTSLRESLSITRENPRGAGYCLDGLPNGNYKQGQVCRVIFDRLEAGAIRYSLVCQ